MKLLSYILLFFLSIGAYGQKASMKLDTAQLRIGEQTVLHLYFEYQNPYGEALIIWPDFDESLTKDIDICLLYTSPSPRDGLLSRMPSSA